MYRQDLLFENEKFGKKIVFYSLGNFIFDTNYQRVHLYTDRGVLLKLIFTEEEAERLQNTETPTETEATEADYISALEDLGVNFNE